MDQKKTSLSKPGQKLLSGLQKTGKTLFGNAKAASGTAILLFFLAVALIGPLLVPYEEIGNPIYKFAAPGNGFLLGCDSQGRDVLAMLIDGTKNLSLIHI